LTGEVFGFSPNYYFNQQSAGLAIYVSPGQIGTTLIPGKVVSVPANKTSQISMDAGGNIFVGIGPYPIAIVVAGAVLTSTPNTLPVSSPGILSIQDIRPQSFTF
jgi:hypothetical protein